LHSGRGGYVRERAVSPILEQDVTSFAARVRNRDVGPEVRIRISNCGPHGVNLEALAPAGIRGAQVDELPVTRATIQSIIAVQAVDVPVGQRREVILGQVEVLVTV